jgi:peroxiredoxin-like protein
MSGKTDKRFLFEVKLNWLTNKTGILLSKEATGTIHVATPPQFGGEGKPWTPEHLFLSSVSSCFMTTYLAFADKLNFHISGLDCESIGQVEIVEGKYKFTRIDLYPRICIADESLREKATTAVEKTNKYCLISNSVNAEIFYHSEILVIELKSNYPGKENKCLQINSLKNKPSL